MLTHLQEQPFVPGRLLPEYANPLGRWVIAPILRLVPDEKVSAMEEQGSLTGVVEILDPEDEPPGRHGSSDDLGALPPLDREPGRCRGRHRDE